MFRFTRPVPVLVMATAALVASAFSAALASPVSASPVSASPVSASPVSANAVSASAVSTRASAQAATSVSAAPSPAFTALAFPAPARGWVAGQASSGGPAQIWHTSTAGATWSVQWSGAGQPLALSAPDPTHAWALIACARSCGRELVATADAGRHWRVVATLPQAVNQIQFASAQLGVATSDSCLADLSLSRCPGQILLTRDGGAHWAPVRSSSAPLFATVSAAGQLWAAALGTTTVTMSTSDDSGHHWYQLGQLASPSPLSPEATVSLAASATGGLTWATVFDQLSCAMHGCGVAQLQHSSDAGQTWSPVTLADGSDDCGSNSIVLSAAPDGSAWAATGRNGAACAPPFGLLQEYSAAGWQQLPSWPLNQVSTFAAVSASVAYAISDDDALVRTTDGGASWAQLLPAPSPAGSLDVLSPATALAARDQSDSGAILRSADGGRSWRQIAQLPGVVTQLDFWSPRDGIAATYQPGAASPWLLWTSSEGGSHWQSAGALPAGSLPAGDGAIDGPWMSASGHGLLLTVTGATPWESGSGGIAPVRVWTTVNHGQTWAPGRLLPLANDLLDGPASFAPSAAAPGRWPGWLVIDNTAGQQRVAVTSGGALTLLPATVPAGAVQLIGPGTGVAWSLNYPGSPSQADLSLAQTTSGGRSWRYSSLRLSIPADSAVEPLLGFSDAAHGWLVLGSRTWHTADNGRTWTSA